MAVDLDADRLEVANRSILRWALKNRAALMPTIGTDRGNQPHCRGSRSAAEGHSGDRLCGAGLLCAAAEKCMGGWGRQFFNISPAGKILPCHAAKPLPGWEFESVRSNHSIAWIWQNSEAFNRYRGTGWMPEPCQSCEFKEIDFGGCRCQAFALTAIASNTDRPARCRRCMSRFFKLAESEAAATTTVSSIATSPVVRWRRAATMPPDADAGKPAATAPIRSRR